MANKTITDLTAGATLDGTEVFHGVQGGNSRKFTSLQLLTPALSAANQAASRVAISAALKGHLFGLTLSNNATDATNDIDIGAGECASEQTNPLLMVYAGGTGAQLDVTYGSGSGGRFDTSISDGTWHCFIISNGTTVGRGFSKSIDPTGQANYPSGYTHYRRIGSVLRVSSAIKAFKQRGDWFAWQSWPQDMNAVSVGTTAALYPLTVPTGIEVEAAVTMSANNASAAGVLLTSPTYDADVVPATAGPSHGQGSNGIRSNGPLEIVTDSSGQIRGRASVAATSVTIHTRGWTDSRGRIF